MIEVCLYECGWLEYVDFELINGKPHITAIIPQDNAIIPHVQQENVPELNGMEGDK